MNKPEPLHYINYVHDKLQQEVSRRPNLINAIYTELINFYNDFCCEIGYKDRKTDIPTNETKLSKPIVVGRVIKDNDKNIYLCENGHTSTCNNDLLKKICLCYKEPNFHISKGHRWDNTTSNMLEYKKDAKTILLIIEQNCERYLQIYDPTYLYDIIENPRNQYLSTKEVATRLGKDSRTISRYCAEGKIKHAKKISNRWMIPLPLELPNKKK